MWHKRRTIRKTMNYRNMQMICSSYLFCFECKKRRNSAACGTANLFTCSPAFAMTMQGFDDPAFVLAPSLAHTCMWMGAWLLVCVYYSLKFSIFSFGRWQLKLTALRQFFAQFLSQLKSKYLRLTHFFLFLWHFQFSSHIVITALFSCQFYLYKKRARWAKAKKIESEKRMNSTTRYPNH